MRTSSPAFSSVKGAFLKFSDCFQSGDDRRTSSPPFSGVKTPRELVLQHFSAEKEPSSSSPSVFSVEMFGEIVLRHFFTLNSLHFTEFGQIPLVRHLFFRISPDFLLKRMSDSIQGRFSSWNEPPHQESADSFQKVCAIQKRVLYFDGQIT